MLISGRTLKNFVLTLITELIGFSANVIIIYILSHLYSQTEFSSYSFSFTFISFFMIMANFGLGSTIIQSVAAKKDQDKEGVQKLVTEGFKLIFIFSAITSLILFIISNFVNSIYNIPDLGIALSFASIYLFFSNLILHFENVFLGIWLYEYYALSKIIFNTLKLMIIFLNFIIRLPIPTILALYALLSMIHFLIFFIIVIKLKYIKKMFSFDFKFIQRILKVSVFMFLPGVFLYIINNFNQFVLAFVITPSEFAVYSITLTIIQIVSLPIIILSNLVFPYVSYYMLKKEEGGKNVQSIFNLTFYYGLLIMIPVTIFIFMFSDQIVISIFGTAYYNASIYIKVFIFYLNFKMIDILGGHFLWAANKPKLVVKLYGITALFTVILSVILIPLFFTYGAILAIIIPHIAYIIITLNKVKKMNNIQFYSRMSLSLIKFLFSSILSGFCSLFFIAYFNIHNYSLYNLALLTVFYFGITSLFLLLTKAIQFNQIKELIKIVRESLRVSNKDPNLFYSDN
jgi:O-antigen/teichoic acid export membrane protein